MKRFGAFTALDGLDAQIDSGRIYGLVGPNGSGKSTLMRLISGVYQPDGGSVTVDGQPVFENVRAKDRIFYLSDDPFYLSKATTDDMADFYEGLYSTFSRPLYEKMKEIFPIDTTKRISTFSKGMRRQSALMTAFASCAPYLLMDEAFDGLDPVIRLATRKLIADEVSGRGMTALISSHNLRELEDLCDHVAILHKGQLLMTREMDNLRTSYCKVQTAFRPAVETLDLPGLSVLRTERVGSVWTLLVRGSEEEVFAALQPLNPVILDCISLTLEEVFISEMEAVGYDYNNFVL